MNIASLKRFAPKDIYTIWSVNDAWSSTRASRSPSVVRFNGKPDFNIIDRPNGTTKVMVRNKGTSKN